MKVGILGATGRMGKALIMAQEKLSDVQITAATCSVGSTKVGQDIGEVSGIGRIGVLLTSSPKSLFSNCEVGIDFSNHESSVLNAKAAAEAGKPLVIGTTGFSDSEMEEIKKASFLAPIVISPNMSVGVNLLLALVENTAKLLDTEYDIEILEMHHRNKIDAPSGTAIALGKSAAKGRGVRLEEAMRTERVGNIGKRIEGEIGFASLRGGDVVGEHSVIFAGNGEKIVLSHQAISREVFANGAYRAAYWSLSQNNGLYSMKDVLGL